MKPKEFIEKYNPCRESHSELLQHDTMHDAWCNTTRIDWLYWLHNKHSPLTKEQSVTLAIAHAESANPDGHPAIDAAKAWLEDPTEENRLAAAGAGGAAGAAAWVAGAAAWAAAAAGAAEAAGAASIAGAAAGADDQCTIFRNIITKPKI